MLKLTSVLFILIFSPLSWSSYLDLDGSSSHLDGPNCWNGAMYASGVLEHRRFMHPDEWNYYLENNCQETETPVAGSVGRLYFEGAEVHGFIHLDDKTVFAKHGEARAHGYKVMSYSEMLDQYGRTRSCRISNSTEESCYHSLKYYTCDKVQDFSAPVEMINEAFQQLSFAQATKFSYRDNCSSESFSAREFELDRIKFALLEVTNSQNRDRELEEVLLKSYLHQLYNIEVSNRNYRCDDRQLKSKKIKEVKELLKSTFTQE